MGIYGIYSPRLVYYTMRHKETWGVVLLGLRAFLWGGGGFDLSVKDFCLALRRLGRTPRTVYLSGISLIWISS